EEGALAVDRDAVAAGEELRPFRLPALDVARDVLPLRIGDERSQARLRVQRVGRDELLRPLDDFLEQRVVGGLLDEEPRAGRAELSLAVEDRVDRAARRRFQIRV